MTVEVRLRTMGPSVPDQGDLVLHFGPDEDRAAKQVADRAIVNRIAYRKLLVDHVAVPEAWLPVSVFATVSGYSLEQLLTALPSRFYGTALYETIDREDIYRILPTDILHDGRPVPFSAAHFDVLVPLGDARIPDDYVGLAKAEQRIARDAAVEPIARFMRLFHPRVLRS